MQSNVFNYSSIFELESGEKLANLQIQYTTYGTLNALKNNVIFVCHALTANSDVADWWPTMVGAGLVLDTEKYFIVCANVLGSCYGTTGPASINPNTQLMYGNKFPFISVRDIAYAHLLLLQHLQINTIELLCGGSLGGQQALELVIMQPNLAKKLFVIATNARHSAWGIAFNETQRMALKNTENGLEVARAIAMLSYRTYATYQATQSEDQDTLDNFKAASYQQYQGTKLAKRFNADSYFILTKTMDSQNVGRGRNSITDALQLIKSKTLVIGISSDILFPPAEQKFIAAHIPNATYQEIDSLFGHDGFLIETEHISQLVSKYLM